MENNYSKLIKYLRVQEGIPQELLAKKIGVSKSNLSRLENNKQNLIVNDHFNMSTQAPFFRCGVSAPFYFRKEIKSLKEYLL